MKKSVIHCATIAVASLLASNCTAILGVDKDYRPAFSGSGGNEGTGGGGADGPGGGAAGGGGGAGGCDACPASFAEQLSGPSLLLHAEEFIYWANRPGSGDQSIQRKSTAGGTTLTPGPGEAVTTTGIAISGTTLYWGTNGGLLTASIENDGTDAQPFTDPAASPVIIPADGSSLAADTTAIYWCDSVTNNVFRYPLPSGPREILATADVADPQYVDGMGAPGEIAVGGGYVFWFDTGSPRVWRVAADGSAVGEEFALLGSAPLISLTTYGNMVYWATSTGNRIYIKQTDAPSADPPAEIDTGGVPIDIAVDGTNVYWTETNAVKWAPATQGAGPQELDSAGGPNGSIAVDDGYVFWARGDVILRKPKL